MASLIIAAVRLLQKVLCSSKEDEPYPQQQGAPPPQQQPQQQYPPQLQEQQQYYPPQQEQQQQYYPPQPPQEQYYPPPQQQQQQHHVQHGADLQNAQNPHYTGLRAQANAEGDAMHAAFDRSKSAYQSGDGAGAHELSQEGHRHQARMEELNREAADWIFRANNTDTPPGTVDLHGLFVQEAIDRTEQALQDARSRGSPSLRLIVGKGLHSQGHIAKLKPAIEDLMQKYRLAAELDPHNEGVLIVHLDGAAGNRGMGSDEVARRLDSGDKCVIM